MTCSTKVRKDRKIIPKGLLPLLLQRFPQSGHAGHGSFRNEHSTGNAPRQIHSRRRSLYGIQLDATVPLRITSALDPSSIGPERHGEPAAPGRRRKACGLLEGAAEGGLRLVTDGMGDGAYSGPRLVQAAGSALHAPAGEILHWRAADPLGEPGSEHRAGGARGAGQRIERPRPRRVGVEERQRPTNDRIAQAGEPAVVGLGERLGDSGEAPRRRRARRAAGARSRCPVRRGRVGRTQARASGRAGRLRRRRSVGRAGSAAGRRAPG